MTWVAGWEGASGTSGDFGTSSAHAESVSDRIRNAAEKAERGFDTRGSNSDNVAKKTKTKKPRLLYAAVRSATF
jgi:hypothetical protein